MYTVHLYIVHCTTHCRPHTHTVCNTCALEQKKNSSSTIKTESRLNIDSTLVRTLFLFCLSLSLYRDRYNAVFLVMFHLLACSVTSTGLRFIYYGNGIMYIPTVSTLILCVSTCAFRTCPKNRSKNSSENGKTFFRQKDQSLLSM